MDKIHVSRFSFRRKGNRRDKEAEREALEYCFDEMTYLSQKEAQAIDEELRKEYTFSDDQLLELAGLACAVAITKVYAPEVFTKQKGAILVCCGPGNNGGDGLVCARHLKLFGYRPTIFYPKRTKKKIYESLVSQCEKMDIPFLSYLPSDNQLVADSYNLIIDAIFGFNFVGPSSADFAKILDQLKSCGLPIISLDIPSGWEVDTITQDGIQPQVLISTTAPKLCSKNFKGKHHYLAGRYVPPDLAKKYKLSLPPFQGSDCCLLIPESNAHSSQHSNSSSDDKLDKKLESPQKSNGNGSQEPSNE